MVMFITFTLLLNFIFLSFYFSCLLWISSLSHISNIFFSFDEFIVETFLYFFLSFMWLPISFFWGHWELNSQLLITSVSNSSDNYSRCYIYCFSNHHIQVLIASMVHVFPFVFLTNFFFVYWQSGLCFLVLCFWMNCVEFFIHTCCIGDDGQQSLGMVSQYTHCLFCYSLSCQNILYTVLYVYS